MKDDQTLWIKPTHTNPVFYRVLNGKIIQLTKDVERELKDGDQIGLLPSSFYFRVSFSKDINNNHESDSDSSSHMKETDDRSSSADQLSPIPAYQRSNSNQDDSVFDFDDEIVPLPSKKTPTKRISLEKESKSLPSVTRPSPTEDEVR